MFDEEDDNQLENGRMVNLDCKKVTFDNISYQYNDVPVLKRVSFELSSNKSYDIIGDSGAGKTTIWNLLSGLLKPYKGKIYIEGLLKNAPKHL